MALEDRRVCPASPAVPNAAMAGRRADRRQNHSAPCRAGIRRHHPVHPLCAVAGRAGREGHLRGSAGVAAAVVAIDAQDITVMAAGEPRPAFDLHCPLLSLPLAFGTQPETIPAAIPYLAAPAERVGVLARSFAAGAAARRVCLVRLVDRTRMTATDRSRWRAWPRYSRIRRSDVSACRRELRMRMAKRCAACRTWSHLGDDIRDFADTAGDHLVARCRDLRRYGGGASGRRAGQAGR